MEIWKDIKGYEGIYQVSNLGNVASKDRRVINRPSGSMRIARGAMMAPWDNGNGYLVVSLRKGRGRKNHYVHRLVAEAFLEIEEGKDIVNHKDYNKHNNSADNLEWCTQKENVEYSVPHMTKPRAVCRQSNTGEKYISRRIEHGKNVKYRVAIKTIGVDRSFENFDDALLFRNEVMQKWQSQ